MAIFAPSDVRSRQRVTFSCSVSGDDGRVGNDGKPYTTDRKGPTSKTDLVDIRAKRKMGHIESPRRTTLATPWNIPILSHTLADGNISRNPVTPHLLPPPQPRPVRSGIDTSTPRDPLSASHFPRAHLFGAAHVLLSLNIGPIQIRS
ncbi:hypothetical protein ACN38_g1718 [Penicillium nordicum]|uniref:Uncharacterized protein n=1 Tax=Penicillium nordicum TaxID=229535 RepID=A0A0M8P8I9_9EURO|nr:hypothetical protein ACN38_g1718 [Penicillium nordicum]